LNRRSFLIFIIIMFLAITLGAQSSPPVFYAESFRQGQTRVLEEKFDVKLTPQDRTYNERIKDSRGNDHYVFSIVPAGPEGDTSITSWKVKLTDLTHPFYGNILLASRQADDSGSPRNNLWILNPSNFAIVPAKAKRIIKIDDFYLVLQVKTFHFTPLDSPYLDSMNVSIEFANTDPRSATDAPK